MLARALPGHWLTPVPRRARLGQPGTVTRRRSLGANCRIAPGAGEPFMLGARRVDDALAHTRAPSSLSTHEGEF